MTIDNQNLGYRLEELERRWALEPDRTVLLQLAEEYGQHERWRDAALVLQNGLERNPDHVAARVALGRSHLRSGYAADACAALELVVEGDPMHLVANKLLVEAYLDTGQVPRARDRLDLYSLLAGADPDIERLEREVAASEQGVPRPPVVRQPESTPPARRPGPAAPTAGSPADGRLFQVAGKLGAAFALHTLPPAGVVESPMRRLYGGTEENPFGALLAQGPEPSLELPSESGQAGQLFGLGAAGVTVLAMAPLGTVASRAEPVPLESPASLESPVPRPPTAVEDGGIGPTGEDAPATVTLGRLYLAQGHAERAEGVFARVLRAEPDNPEARAGLAEARAATGWTLTAEHLLRDRELPAGPSAEQRELLASYLERIRTSGSRSGGVSTA